MKKTTPDIENRDVRDGSDCVATVPQVEIPGHPSYGWAGLAERL